MRNSHRVAAILFVVTALSLCPRVEADEKEIRSSLAAGLSAYNDDATQCQQEIRTHFNIVTLRARTKGDAKEVDNLSAQRARFDKVYVLSKSFPDSFRKRHESSIRRTEKAFDAAHRAALKEQLDQLAERIADEKAAFLAEVRPVLVLAETKPEKVLVDRDWFTTDGRGLLGLGIGGDIIFNGKKYKEAILAAPPPSAYSEVSFPLDGSWETFSARVGVPFAQDDPKRKKVGSKLTFDVRADEASIWVSNGSDDIDTLQVCNVAVPSEAKVLRLRAHCGKNGLFARTTWVEPRLTSLRFKTVE